MVMRLDVEVRNMGNCTGADVVQLYLRYPAAAGEPELVLRDFRKTPPLGPGEKALLHFGLTSAGLSVWDSSYSDWRRINGEFEAVVGRSSRDAVLIHRFTA